jgi:hypothetical protein
VEHIDSLLAVDLAVVEVEAETASAELVVPKLRLSPFAFELYYGTSWWYGLCVLYRTSKTVSLVDLRIFRRIPWRLCLLELVAGRKFVVAPKPRIRSSSEAPGHFRRSDGLLPSLAKVIVSTNAFVHLLEQLLQGLRKLLSKVLS